jgi:hypothetical protein
VKQLAPRLGRIAARWVASLERPQQNAQLPVRSSAAIDAAVYVEQAGFPSEPICDQLKSTLRIFADKRRFEIWPALGSWIYRIVSHRRNRPSDGVASLDNLRHKFPEDPARMNLKGLAYCLEFLQHTRADPDANHGVEFVGHAHAFGLRRGCRKVESA